MRKLIDAQGKLLGFINLFDLAIIIMLMALGFKVLTDYKPVSPDFRYLQVSVDLLVADISPYLVDSVVIGQDVYQDNTGAYLGKIINIQAAPAELTLPQHGTLLLVKSPRNLDMRIRLQNRGREISGPAQAGVYLGKLAVRVGDSLRVHTMYASFPGEVERLKVKGNRHH